jgi:Zn-dependent protease
MNTSFLDKLSSPLIWAVLISWILSVTLHEFAHGLVAYWGGDYTIRERGGLTLNPLQYVDPINSILLPIIFLLMGGIPLPGGVTYVRRDLIRGKLWNSAVSLAGPAMNFLLFVAFAIPVHPKVGWVADYDDAATWTTVQIFCGTMALLQAISVLLNLIPIPPLDGFNAIAPFLPVEFRRKVLQPPTSTILFIGLFIVLLQTDLLSYILRAVLSAMEWIGFDGYFFARSYQTALFPKG